MEVSVDKTRRTVDFHASNGGIYQSTNVVGTTTWEIFSAIGTDTFVTAPSAVGGNLKNAVVGSSGALTTSSCRVAIAF